MLQNAIERAMRQIVIRLARDCNASFLDWVLKLTMTPLGYCQIPAVISEQPKDLAHLHVARILSHVEPEIHYIAFLHDVVFPFQSG